MGAKGDTGAQGTPGLKGDTGTQGPPGVGIDALFGDGSDGNVEISSDTTLSRDMYYDNLTIDAGATLVPSGNRVFVSGTLTLDDGARILAVGPASGTLGGGGLGGASNTIGQGEPNSLGGAGGDGAPCSGICLGGGVGPIAAAAGGKGVFRQALAAISGRSLDGTIVNGGAGGGGGTGGAGGTGGGVVVVAAQTITVNGNAQVQADGFQGQPTGGGGGGGVVVVISDTPQPAGITLSAKGGDGLSGGGNGGPGFTDWLN